MSSKSKKLMEKIENHCETNTDYPVLIEIDDLAAVVIIKDHLPTDVYALIEMDDDCHSGAQAISIIEDALWLDGVDVEGFRAYVVADSFIPEHNPWPEDVVALLKHLRKPINHLFQVHIDEIIFGH